MKKRTVLILLIAIFLAAGSVQAGLVYNEADLSKAIQEVADLKDENIVFIEEPEGVITEEIDTDRDFLAILDELLSDTGLRAVEHSNYYLIGRFSHDSVEFASKSETIFYRAKHLSAGELADELDTDDLRVQVFEERDKLLIQGLSVDVKEAREKLASIDVADNLYQIQYDLVVIDITEEKDKNLSLDELTVSSEEDDGFQFVYSDSGLEVLTSEIIERMAGTAQETSLESLSIANPSLITEVGSTGYLNMSEEIISWGQEDVILQEIEFSTEITPYNITGGGEIETDVEFLVGSGTDFSTTVRLPAGETELIGLLKMSEEKVAERLIGKDKYDRERTYAIYITAAPAEDGPVARLGGIDNLIFQNNARASYSEASYFQVLFDDQLRLDLDFHVQDEITGNIVDFKTRSGLSYLEFGLGLPIVNGLSLDTKTVITDYNQLSWLLGLVDRVEITENLKLKAGLYPVVFSFNQPELKNYAGYGEISYTPAPLIFNLKYLHNLGEDTFRFETGLNLESLPYLMVAATGDLEGLNKLLFGLRFQF